MNTTAGTILATLANEGIRLVAHGETLRWYAAPGKMTPELLAWIKRYKPMLLKMLTTAVMPSKCAWRVDSRGLLWFSDGTCYAPTTKGGWILIECPGKRMLGPGLIGP